MATTYLKIAEEIKALSDKKEIKERITRFAKEKSSSTYNTYKNAVSNLAKELKKIDSYPEELAEKYGEYINFCGVTYCYEVIKEDEYKKFTIKKETVQKTAKKPAEVVKIDWEPIYKKAIKDLKSEDWQLVGFAICWLTQRRPVEVFTSITKFQADDENTLIVQNLAKKRGDNATKAYRVPCFYNSDEIEAAKERLHQLHPMSDVISKFRESDDFKSARELFNKNYCGGDRGLNNRFKEYYGDIVPLDKLAESNSDSLRVTRKVGASLWYWMYKKKFNCSMKDAIAFAKSTLAHDTDGVALKYTDIEFLSLPENDYSDDVFDINKMSEVPISQDKIESLNITKLYEMLDVTTQTSLNETLKEFGNLEKALAHLISKGVQQEKITQGIGDTKITTTQKMANVVLAIIRYNYAQKQKESPLYVHIGLAMLDRVSLFIFEKRCDPNTIKTVLEGMEDIESCHDALGINEKNNYKLRGKDKMSKVLTAIKNEFEKL